MTARCADCRWLERRADRLEASLGGWRVLSSADASVRGDDGLCLRHDRFVAPGGGCAAFGRADPAPVSRRSPAARP